MKKENLETYLGKEVYIIFNEGDTTSGVLLKGGGYAEGYYQCDDGFYFRSSHVKKIKEIES